MCSPETPQNGSLGACLRILRRAEEEAETARAPRTFIVQNLGKKGENSGTALQIMSYLWPRRLCCCLPVVSIAIPAATAKWPFP